MATFTITTAQNIDVLTAKAGGDLYNVNGGTLTIDQDSRYGLEQTTSTSLGNITISATLGGTVEIDARFVRLIPYNSGSGNVPALNTSITQGSASGKLIGVWSSLTAAPTAVGVAMPASGFIKIKAWNSVAYTASALTGIGATATGPDTVGWIELVGDAASTQTTPRLGTYRMRGEWYALGTTSGSSATTYQVPTSGSLQYIPGVWVETGTSTGIYEFYPNAGSLTALLANIATDSVRGKSCWIKTDGLVRFQHDGSNSTGGYLPPSGRLIRIPNIITANCTTAARTANVLPNVTLASRYDWVATGGVITIDKANLAWAPNFSQAYSVSLTNVGILDQLSVNELASAAVWSQIGVGQTAAQSQTALNLTVCLAGGTITDCVWSRSALATAVSVIVMTDCSGWAFVGGKSFSFVARANVSAANAILTRVVNGSWTNHVIGGGQHSLTTCTTLTYTTCSYWDDIKQTTPTANPMYAFNILANSSYIKVDGLDFAGLTLQQPYSGIMSVGVGCNNIKLRNLGTAASQLDMGGARVDGRAWTRATSVATLTSTAHGLKVNDQIYVIVSTDITAITIGLKTVATVVDANTITFACFNAGGVTGTLSHYPSMAAVLLAITASAAASNIKIQRCYCPHLRTNLFTSDNSAKTVLYESVFGDFPNAPVTAELNATVKMLQSTHAMTAQSNPVYGSHWFDTYTTHTPANLSAQSWARTTTTATLTSTAHGLRTGDTIVVTVTSSAAAIVLGSKSITTTGVDTFTFTCLNAGSASGTLSYVAANGRIGLLMNEASDETSTYYTIDSGTPAFTAAGGFYMPTIGQQITFIPPVYLKGHSSFPILEAVMAGGTISNHDITYAIDKNDGTGYSSFKNLYYRRAGGSGSAAATTFTVTSGTGVAVGDYVWGTGIAPNAKVTVVDTNTITVDIANTGAVSGIIRFNQLPSESSISAANGFKLKIRILTSTTNVAAITSLYVVANSIAADRAQVYDLDPVPIKVTVKDAITFAVIQDARVYLTASGGGPQTDGTVLLTGVSSASGIVENTIFAYLGNQSFTGKVRKSTSGTLYKTAVTTGTITSTGLDLTVFLIQD